MTGRFAGRTAVVTGAASGIGAATARRLAAEGAAVVLADVAPADLLAAEIGRAVAIRADASKEDDWARVAATARETFGPVGVLVSNAYAVEIAPADATTLASWEHQIAVSLTGTFLGVKALLPDLLAHDGAVVVVSSVHALVGLPGRPAYAAAKGGLVALARQLAVEYGPALRVNTVLPGPILTPAWEQVSAEDHARSVAATVAGRFGTPDEVAAAIAFLASPDAAYVTGTSLVVDGGWTAAKSSG